MNAKGKRSQLILLVIAFDIHQIYMYIYTRDICVYMYDIDVHPRYCVTPAPTALIYHIPVKRCPTNCLPMSTTLTDDFQISLYCFAFYQ